MVERATSHSNVRLDITPITATQDFRLGHAIHNYVQYVQNEKKIEPEKPKSNSRECFTNIRSSRIQRENRLDVRFRVF